MSLDGIDRRRFLLLAATPLLVAQKAATPHVRESMLQMNGYALNAETPLALLTVGCRNDDVTFMRTDREFNTLCSAAAHNEFAAGAMTLMHSLSRRFWYIHYKQAADMPLTAKLHADIARAIADGDAERAAKSSDRLLDEIEKFTRETMSASNQPQAGPTRRRTG